MKMSVLIDIKLRAFSEALGKIKQLLSSTLGRISIKDYSFLLTSVQRDGFKN
jgi:hypothetical protein